MVYNHLVRGKRQNKESIFSEILKEMQEGSGMFVRVELLFPEVNY